MTKRVAFVKWGDAVEEYLATRGTSEGRVYEGQSAIYLEQFLEAVEGKGIEPLILSTGARDRNLEIGVGHIATLGSPKGTGVGYVLGQAWMNLRIVRWLHRADPDTVLFALPRPVFWISWLYCILTRRNLIASFHGAVFNGWSISDAVDRWWLRRFLSLKAVLDVWAISPDLAEQLRRLHPRRPATVIYPRYDESFSRPSSAGDEIPGEAYVVTFLGRVVEAKGVFDLVEIVEALEGRIDELCCVVVGDGPDLPSMKQLVEERGMSDRFVFTGYRRQVQDLLARSDVLVLPTTRRFNEGLNKAAIEGLLCEVPLVVSDVCGLRGTVSQGVGYVVEPGDVEGFADRIETIRREPAVRDRFLERARALKRVYLNPPATLGSELTRHLPRASD